MSQLHESSTARRVLRHVARLGRGVARGLAAAYHSVDPDARRHIAQAPVLGLTLIAKRRKPATALPDDGARPVICVHGLGGHRGNFALVRAWLRLTGRSRTYSLGFARGVTLDGMALALRAEIARVIEVNDLPADATVDLVCHSMGGLVARMALQHPGTARRVATVVTLGTPHFGTHAARFAGTQFTRALRPDSPLFDRLSPQIPWSHRGPRLVCLWTRDDVLLLPATTARVPGADNREVPGITHLSYLLHPVAFQAVSDALAVPAPRLGAPAR